MTIPFLQFLISHFYEQVESPQVRRKGYKTPKGLAQHPAALCSAGKALTKNTPHWG